MAIPKDNSFPYWTNLSISLGLCTCKRGLINFEGSATGLALCAENLSAISHHFCVGFVKCFISFLEKTNCEQHIVLTLRLCTSTTTVIMVRKFQKLCTVCTLFAKSSTLLTKPYLWMEALLWHPWLWAYQSPCSRTGFATMENWKIEWRSCWSMKKPGALSEWEQKAFVWPHHWAGIAWSLQAKTFRELGCHGGAFGGTLETCWWRKCQENIPCCSSLLCPAVHGLSWNVLA